MQTPRSLQASLPRGGGNASNVAALYALGDAALAKLKAARRIEASDLAALDRRSRCIVASDLWGCCAQDARTALLTDEHHFVRACAKLSEARP